MNTHKLSPTEVRVYELLGTGRDKHMVAEVMQRDVKTIETHRENMKAKLGLKTVSELVFNAVQDHLNKHRNDTATRYAELIFSVCRKFDGETRHETALRYIREAESNCGGGPDASEEHDEIMEEVRNHG